MKAVTVAIPRRSLYGWDSGKGRYFRPLEVFTYADIACLKKT
jgi:hypothetical protein